MRTVVRKYQSILFLVVLAICVTGRPLASQQSPQQRQVNFKILNRYAPIQITSVLALGKVYPIHLGRNQEATFLDRNPDWIDDVSFTVENHSQKNIVAIEAMVYVPAWEKNPARPHNFIRFHEGQFPEHALHLGDGTLIPEESTLKLDIKPGSTGNIPLTQALHKLLNRFPSPSAPVIWDQEFFPKPLVPLASVDSIWIQMERIFFDDGTMWAFYNGYSKPDAASSGAYIQITPEQWKSYTNVGR